ncbi:MAG: hypothetical protein EBU66_16080, partial [Bacteroidetes bacterium]|nr:hypothetical protein [Bacteroidota bacterium]
RTCPTGWNTYKTGVKGCWKSVGQRATDVVFILGEDMITLPPNVCPPAETVDTYYDGPNNPIPTAKIQYTFTGSECVRTCPTGWNTYKTGLKGCWKSVGQGAKDVVFILGQDMITIPKNICPAPATLQTTYMGGFFTKNPQPTINVPYTATPTQCIQKCPLGWKSFTENGGGCLLSQKEVLLINKNDLTTKTAITPCPPNYTQSGTSCIISSVKSFNSNTWNQPDTCTNTTVNYVNPAKEGFATYEAPIQIRESTFPLNKMGFGNDRIRNSDTPPLHSLYVEPLRQKITLDTAPGPKYVNADDTLKPERANSYRYIRFRPIKTRNPDTNEVHVGKFRFFLGPNEIDMGNAKVSNPMGTWVGDIEDVIGRGYTNGWSDAHKKALVFSFPYSVLINGFTWITASPEKGIDGDPVQWKLEGSDNGVYWVTLRNQTNHNYPVPKERFQELPIFRF